MSLEEVANREHILTEKSELAQAFEHLDNDSFSPDRKTSAIDANTRLSSRKMSAVLKVDALQRLGIIPDDFTLVHQLKRLAISLDGKGREEKVRMAIADRETKQGTAGWNGIKRLFTPRE